MKTRLEDKHKAIALRKKGLTYKDIMREIPVSKSLLSGWFKFLDLSTEEEEQLRMRAKINKDNGNSRAALSNRKKRIEREKVAQQEAQKIFKKYENDPNFILGIGLYWAEGSKRTSAFQFMNSDPQMILFMIYWAKIYLKINKNNIYLRIHTHEDFKLEKYEEFWSTITKIPLEQFRKTSYKPNTHGIFKKNPKYKGCVRIEVSGGIKTLRILLYLNECLENKLKMLY
ncbi:MAG: hypothetical protein UU13_C0013G0010 [Candidatus Nomurabacteria bacterium GW2011_GWB1_40_7]|uniref:Resolvase helix-turn-helix domain protein n=1 Tax=Candidatus Nomurabacteria bacterium GW2011_GWB1_40_7 TaxID=1618744 RepID=A0A0G0VDN8_9BACT|nr:MAG: hypothetical protein UU13_C0013G0010 [Candidatus Nomurabacteria bacterium GW2011_GWB1_40_7]